MDMKLKIVPILFVLALCYVFIIPALDKTLGKITGAERVIKFLKAAIYPGSDEYLITFVTAFINIGQIEKNGGFVRDKSTYLRWMREYSRMRSPMVIYSNDLEFLSEFMTIRKNYKDITESVFLANLTNLIGFKHLSQIEKIYADPNYPKIRGVTTNAKYTCVMHSKYDFLEMTLEQDYFSTPYVAWIDVGYLRNMGGSNATLNVYPPPQLDESRVSFNKVFEMDPEASIANVMTRFSQWVGGGFFLATPSVMTKFISQYRQFVDKMMTLSLMSSDETIIYAMYTKEGHIDGMIELQLYSGQGDKCDRWFHIIYRMTNHSCAGNTIIQNAPVF